MVERPTRLRVALIGCGRRAAEVYLPVIQGMPDHFLLTAVCDEIPERAESLGRRSGAGAFCSPDDLLAANVADLGVVCVTPPPSPRNGEVLLRCVEAGLPVLAETPIAKTMEEADRILAAGSRSRARVEIAENYWRTTWERAKRALIDAG